MLPLTLAAALAASPPIEGTWIPVSTETDGKPVAREKLSELKVVIGGGRLEYVYVGKPGQPNLVYQLTLDPSASPKQFTLTHVSNLKSSAVPGIYELDGDALRLCFADGEGREARRPKAFATGPGTRQVLLTLKRDASGDPVRVMKAMDGYRKTLPEPQGLGEMNGTGVPDIDGNAHPDSHLRGIGVRLGVKTRAECMALLTYLKDKDPKIRRIAAFALEHLLKAYPNGMSSGDIQDVDSDGHRKMVEAFIAGIAKLPN